MTSQDVEDRITKLDTERLKRLIAEDSKDYTREALAIAKEELASRGEEAAVVEASASASAEAPARLSPGASLIGSLLGLVGYALLGLGLILGVLLYGKTKLVLCLGTAAGTAATGLLFLGVAEAIKLLMELKDRSDNGSK
ncbi:MAG: hypothetical protein ABI333_17935 [bacterium]